MGVEVRGFTTTDGIDLNEIYYDTVLPILDIYNTEEVIDLKGLLCFSHDESYYKFPINEKWKFQKLGEAEVPTSRKIVYGKRQKDTEKYGVGVTYTFDWLMSEQSSSSEIAKLAAKAINSDRDLVTAVIITEAMKSTGTDGFYNASFSTEEKLTQPPIMGVNSFGSSHTHYVNSGAASITVASLTAAKEHIKEHGYRGRITGFCNGDFMKNIEDLAGFFMTTTATYTGVGKLEDEVMLNGFQGRILGIDWIATEWMTDDYFLLIGTRPGEDKPLMFTEKKNPAAKGLILTPGSYNAKYPLINATYLRWFAIQAAYRGAGVAYYISASAYTSPSATSNVLE